MKKIFAFLILAGLLPSFLLASPQVWLSSNTATADTTQNLCIGKAGVLGNIWNNRGIFHGVCVNTGVAGTFTVYNSSGAASSPIAAVNTATSQPCSFYDVAVSSGLTYTNSATANLTILYECY